MSSGAATTWLTRLNLAELPGIRHLARAARLIGRIRHLGALENKVAYLGSLGAALDAKVTALETERQRAVAMVAELSRCCAYLEVERIRAAHVVENMQKLVQTQAVHRQQELGTLEHKLLDHYRHLHRQTDLLKSACEVPKEWFDEFRRWRAANPVPDEPLVSICVGTWNRAKLLTERCLPSLLNQTYRRLEIIVVGDGCTDDTADRVAALGDPRIWYVNLPARGRYPDEPLRRWQVAGTQPVNHALGLCSGYFITHLDDDDEHMPTRVEKLVEYARANGLDFVWHPFEVEYDDGHWETRACDTFNLSYVTTSSIFYKSWLGRIGWDVNAHLLEEPGDWNRLRKFIYLGVRSARYPEVFLKHYKERTQVSNR